MQAQYIAKSRQKKQKHTYCFSLACSPPRASTKSNIQFFKAFKTLIARRGSPNIVYSDNAKTYVAAAKWIQNIKRHVLFQDFLIKEEIQWKFNLSRVPW